MRVSKFKSAGFTEPGEFFFDDVPIIVDYLIDDPNTPGYPEFGRVLGFGVMIDVLGFVRMENNDFIISDSYNNAIRIVKQADYSSTALVRVEIDQIFADGIVREIVAAHNPQNNGQEIAFNNQMSNAKNYAQFGKLNKFRDEINAINDNGVIASQKKAEVIAKIDNHMQ